MVDVSFVFWIDSNPALNACEPDSSTLPDSKNTAQLGRDHQLALRRHHTFKLFHALHFNTKSKTLPRRWPAQYRVGVKPDMPKDELTVTGGRTACKFGWFPPRFAKASTGWPGLGRKQLGGLGAVNLNPIVVPIDVWPVTTLLFNNIGL